MSHVMDDVHGKAPEFPAQAAQPNGQVKFFVAVQISVGKVSRRFNGATPVQSATVEPVYSARFHVRARLCTAGNIFKAFGVQLNEQASDASDIGMCQHEVQRDFQKAFEHLHVTVEKIDELPMRMLVTQLRADTAAAIVRIGELHNAYGIRQGQLDGSVRRARVSQNDLAAYSANCTQCALYGG